MNKKLISQVKAAWRASVPLLAITTPDPAATFDAINEAVGDQVFKGKSNERPVAKIVWDIAQGMKAGNPAGKEAIALARRSSGLTPATTCWA